MNADDPNNLKHVKEYTLPNYTELGTRLGEAMFYFVKYQNFIDQLEKSSQYLITKELALAFDTRARENAQWKEQAARRPILTVVRGEPASTTAGGKLAETAGSPEGEIMSDIFKEFSSRAPEKEDSDASFDEDILEERKLKSLTHMSYKEQRRNETETHTPVVEMANERALKRRRENSSYANVGAYYEAGLRSNNERRAGDRRGQLDRRRPIELISCTVNYGKGYASNCTAYSNNNFPPQKMHRLMVTNPWVNRRKLRNSSVLNATVNSELELKPFLMFLRQRPQTRPGTSQGLHRFKNDFGTRKEFGWRNEVRKPAKRNCMFSIESQRVQMFDRMSSKNCNKSSNKLSIRRNCSDYD